MLEPLHFTRLIFGFFDRDNLIEYIIESNLSFALLKVMFKTFVLLTFPRFSHVHTYS